MNGEFDTPLSGGAGVFDSPAVATSAPSGAITSQTYSGQDVTISGTTANTPTSGLATLTATGGGGVTQGPSAVTLGSGTFTITFTGVPAGDYSPTVTLTNAGGTNSATGGSAFSMSGVGGEGDASSLVSADFSGSYAVKVYVSADFSGAYHADNTYTAVSADLAATYRVYGYVSSDLTGGYAVTSTVSADFSGAYSVDSISLTVSADLSAAYSVLESVFCDLFAGYAVGGTEFVRAPRGSGYRSRRAELTTSTRLLVAPIALAVDLQQAKDQLRIDGDDMDAMVTAWIDGITAHAEHCLGRALIKQTWRVTMDAFPDAIPLYKVPVVEVSSVKFYDENGVIRILDPQDYELDAVSEPACIVPAPDAGWPDTQHRVNAVQVDFIAGYGDSHELVPKGIKTYIYAKLVEQFDAKAKAVDLKELFVDRLLDRYKVYA